MRRNFKQMKAAFALALKKSKQGSFPIFVCIAESELQTTVGRYVVADIKGLDLDFVYHVFFRGEKFTLEDPKPDPQPAS